MKIVDPFEAVPLDWTLKGVSPQFDGHLAGEIGQSSASLFSAETVFPLAVLKEPVLSANSRWMKRFIELSGVKIAPHGKTTMAPALFRQQIDDGAWAITTATIHQVQACRRFGVQRILMANQLIGDAAISWVVGELEADPSFEFYCLVDSEHGLRALRRVAQDRGATRPIQVLIEVGCVGGRAGVRTMDQGLVLARSVRACAPFVRLAGIETFEGLFQMAPDGSERAQGMLNTVVDLAVAADSEDLFDGPILLTGGGSGFYDLAAKTLAAAQFSREHDVVLRSGCYLTHDNDMYRGLYAALVARSDLPAAIGYDLEPALEVWAHVQSIPEPGRIICGLGRRDVGNDAHQPRLISWARTGDTSPKRAPEGYSVTALYDQHAFVDGPAESPFQVGDLVGFGVSHPCTTFDKWRALIVVDETWKISRTIRTYF